MGFYHDALFSMGHAKGGAPQENILQEQVLGYL